MRILGIDPGTGILGFGVIQVNKGKSQLVDAGVIDPVKVVRCALENTASVSSLMLTTETMIADAPKKDEPPMPGAGAGMGGMGGMGGMM